MDADKPRLIETGTHMYLKDILKSCHNYRSTVYYYSFNAIVFLLFIGIAGLVLYYCNKQKLSNYEKNQRLIRDQRYILSKIRYYQEDNKKQKEQLSSITNLPIGNPDSFRNSL
jgi:hypothetical protein